MESQNRIPLNNMYLVGWLAINQYVREVVRDQGMEPTGLQMLIDSMESGGGGHVGGKVILSARWKPRGELKKALSSVLHFDFTAVVNASVVVYESLQAQPGDTSRPSAIVMDGHNKLYLADYLAMELGHKLIKIQREIQ